jgi:DNA uptake protein ComE-like DNA-binding protein
VWSVGLLAFAPFLRLALARRQARDWWVFAAYLAAVAVLIVLLSVSGTSGPASTALGGVIIALVGVASVHTFVAFRPGSGALPGAAAQASSPNAAAVAAALTRQRRRSDARKLARDNPALARDLRIGRPDLPRQYDDGGLVDVNHVPAEVLASHLELTPQEAAAVVTARAKLGRFTSPEELSAYSELQPDRVDELRDLMFFD